MLEALLQKIERIKVPSVNAAGDAFNERLDMFKKGIRVGRYSVGDYDEMKAFFSRQAKMPGALQMRKGNGCMKCVEPVPNLFRCRIN